MESIDEPTASEPEPSFTELFAELATEVGSLVRQEVTLAADEMAGKARHAGQSALVAIVGALLGAVSLLVLVFALVLALGNVLPMWLSALVISAAIGAAGYTLYRRGATALRTMELLPTETFTSLDADRTWAKREIAATRATMSSTIGEVRRRLTVAPPAKKKRRPAPG